jgi:hypothetical protein
MPILEDLKEYAERTTGLARPGKRQASGFTKAGNRTPSASRTTALSRTIRDGR